jgi:hypothetical protein
MIMVVADRGQLRGSSFALASTPIPDLEHEDYTRKAILAVSEYLTQGVLDDFCKPIGVGHGFFSLKSRGLFKYRL